MVSWRGDVGWQVLSYGTMPAHSISVDLEFSARWQLQIVMDCTNNSVNFTR